MDGLFLRRDLHHLHPLQLLDSALHLLGLCGLVTETIDERLELLHLFLLVAIGGFELFLALRLLRYVLFVVPAVEPDLFVPDLDGSIDGHVEKITIVRNQYDRVGIAFKIGLQPVASLEIEVEDGGSPPLALARSRSCLFHVKQQRASTASRRSCWTGTAA